MTDRLPEHKPWPGASEYARHVVFTRITSYVFLGREELLAIEAPCITRISPQAEIPCPCGLVIWRLPDLRAEIFHGQRIQFNSSDFGVIELRSGPKKEVPTTACFDCETIIPVADTYVSTRDERALCETCFKKAEKAGRAKCHVVR